MTSNNVNVELRPGTRLVRETQGNREIMWVEDDTLFSSSGGFWSGLLGLIALIIIIFIGSMILKPSNSDATSTTRVSTQPNISVKR